VSYYDEVLDSWQSGHAIVPRQYALTIATRADARIAELERECEQWRDELRIYRETESAQIAEIEADAARYRWIRAGHTNGPYIVDWHGCMIDGSDADEEVDAARAGNGGADD